MRKRQPEFERRTIICKSSDLHTSKNSKYLKILVVNSCRQMAEEITLQIALNIDDCSVLYAPTIAAAKAIISKNIMISLIVASPVMPDGNINKLKDQIEQLKDPPDLVVVSDTQNGSILLSQINGYRLTSTDVHNSNKALIIRRRQNSSDSKLKELGADLRNDLNNPLQEIVTCVYVAQSSESLSPLTEQALKAIEKAALNMASLVGKLEDRIRKSVSAQPLP